MRDPDLARCTSEGFAEPDSLTPIDRHRAAQAMVERLMIDYNEWQRREEGLMHEAEDAALMRRGVVRGTLST
jgi:hypothetical protein